VVKVNAFRPDTFCVQTPFAFISEPGKNYNDIVFLVSDTPIALRTNKASKQQQTELAKKEISIEPKNTFVVTDDYNPLESMQVVKVEHYRELLMKRLGKKILLR